MKIENKKLFFIVGLLFCFSAVSQQEIAEGVFYEHAFQSDPNQSIHILTVDPKKSIIDIGVSHDRCASSEKPSHFAKRTGATAVINGGFFQLRCLDGFQEESIKILDRIGIQNYNTYPDEMLRNKKGYFSISNALAGAVIWNSEEQKPIFDYMKTNALLKIGDYEYTEFEFNQRNSKQPALYSKNYGKRSPRSYEKVDLIVINNGVVVNICRKTRKSAIIPENGYVYAIPKEYREQASIVAIGDPVNVSLSPVLKNKIVDASKYDRMLGARPLLLSDGEFVNEQIDERFSKRHPRTAVGILANGTWLFVVVDGRTNESQGFTMNELAEFMKNKGCTDALNLEGGGSSTMVIQGNVVNRPCGRGGSLIWKERALSNVFLIYPK